MLPRASYRYHNMNVITIDPFGKFWVNPIIATKDVIKLTVALNKAVFDESRRVESMDEHQVIHLGSVRADSLAKTIEKEAKKSGYTTFISPADESDLKQKFSDLS